MDAGGIVWLVFVVLVLIAAAIFGHARRLGLEKEWRHAADKLGLRFSRSGSDITLEGAIGGFRVQLRAVKRDKSLHTELSVQNPRMPASLTLKSEGGWQSLRKIVAGQDVLTGDDEFDALIHVGKDEATALALLDSTTRARVRSFLRGWERSETAIADGWLTWRRRGATENTASLVGLAREGVATAQLLTLERAEIRHRLAQNAGDDPCAGVRRRNLEVLGRVAPGSDLWLNCARTALDDVDGGVRAFAAMSLGHEELPRLLEIAARDPEASVRAKVITHLAAFAGEALWPAIARALRKRDPHLKRAAILAAGATNYVALAPDIAKEAAHPEVSVVEAVARCLGQLGAADTEAMLVSLLEHRADEVRVASAEALGKFGTVVAVEPLLAHTSGVLKDATLKRAAQEAIASIQSRLGPVEMGRLSLTISAPLEGALSHVDEPIVEGALTLAEAESVAPERDPARSR
jgi:HEAT repeat protein